MKPGNVQPSRPLVAPPGYKEAIARERHLRDMAFCAGQTLPPLFVIGLPIRTATLIDLQTLSLEGNPLGFGVAPSADEIKQSPIEWGGYIARFLFALHADFHPLNTRLLTRIEKKVAKTSIKDLAEQLKDYIDFVFMDAPQPEKKNKRIKKSFFSPLAEYIHFFGTKYGWQIGKVTHKSFMGINWTTTESGILTTPLPILTQMMRAWEKYNDKHACLENPSDKLIAAMMKARLKGGQNV